MSIFDSSKSNINNLYKDINFNSFNQSKNSISFQYIEKQDIFGQMDGNSIGINENFYKNSCKNTYN